MEKCTDCGGRIDADGFCPCGIDHTTGEGFSPYPTMKTGVILSWRPNRQQIIAWLLLLGGAFYRN